MIGRATSDIHLTARTAELGLSALRVLRDDAASRGGFTVLAGDIFDTAHSVHMPTWNALRDLLHSFNGAVYVIPGNHDQYGEPELTSNGKFRIRNALEGLAGGPVEVINEALRVHDVGLLIPYHPPDLFMWWLDRTRAGIAAKGYGANAYTELGASIWWTHQGWWGSYLNNMTRDWGGLKQNGLDADLVVSGHYHMPQSLGKVIYCGSPYQVSFAEEGQEKGWLKWEGDNPLPERVPFNLGAPNHWTLHWEPEKGPPAIPDEYRTGDKMRIVTTATRSVAKAASAQLEREGLSGVAVLAKPDTTAGRVVTPGTSPKDAAVQYVEAVYGPDHNRPHPVGLLAWAKDNLWR